MCAFILYIYLSDDVSDVMLFRRDDGKGGGSWLWHNVIYLVPLWGLVGYMSVTGSRRESTICSILHMLCPVLHTALS